MTIATALTLEPTCHTDGCVWPDHPDHPDAHVRVSTVGSWLAERQRDI